VRAEKQRPGRAFGQVEIKRVHVVADGVVLGNIQRFEIVVRRFDFRAFDDGKADGKKDVFNFLHHRADQMVRANRTNHAREREVDAIFCRGSYLLGHLDFEAFFLQFGFNV
jgi:hypothetical protein